jgi:epsilon-lactone hydrolase
MASRDIDAIRAMLAALPTEDVPMDELRRRYDAFSTVLLPPASVSIEPAELGGVKGEWITPAQPVAGRTMLYLHGGGYVIGSPTSHRHLAGAIAEAVAAPLFVADYRMAPDHPFPAAVEDALAAYEALLERGQDPAQLIVAGDSAGGGLTLATLLAARDRRLPLPAAAVLISPWTDLGLSGETMTTLRTRDPILHKKRLVEMAGLYLDGKDPLTPLASPLYADLAGLPPLLIQVGSEELLLDDSRRLAARAADQGVAAELEIWDEMIHVWHFFYPQLQEGREAIAKIGAFVAAASAKAVARA